MSLVIYTWKDYKDGENVINVHAIDWSGKDCRISFTVVRKATREEYLKSLQENNGIDPLPVGPWVKYYEVQMD